MKNIDRLPGSWSDGYRQYYAHVFDTEDRGIVAEGVVTTDLHEFQWAFILHNDLAGAPSLRAEGYAKSANTARRHCDHVAAKLIPPRCLLTREEARKRKERDQ